MARMRARRVVTVKMCNRVEYILQRGGCFARQCRDVGARASKYTTLIYDCYNLSSYSNLRSGENDGGNARIAREAAHASQCDVVGKRRLNACDSSLHTAYDAYATNATPRK